MKFYFVKIQRIANEYKVLGCEDKKLEFKSNEMSFKSLTTALNFLGEHGFELVSNKRNSWIMCKKIQDGAHDEITSQLAVYLMFEIYK